MWLQACASILGQLLAGWLIADFLSGLAHWWEDRVGRLDTPLLGRWIIAPNRRHHTQPLDFTRGTLVERNLPVWVITAVVAALWLGLGGPSLILGAALVGGLVVNEVHRLAHLPTRAGRWTRVAWEIGLLQSPKHHSGHHRPPSDARYCILTDWLNPLLDAIGFWAGLEAVLAACGMEPNRGLR